MTQEIYVIKRIIKGCWVYFTGEEDYNREWANDVYRAKRFKNNEEAVGFLQDAFKTRHWGGFFTIEKFYVSR
jgi:hypothetical protein